MLSRAKADPPSRDCSTKKGLSWCHQCPHPVPHRTRWMMPASEASVTSHHSSRLRTRSNSRPSGSGNSSSTAGRSQSQKQWGWERGWGSNPDSALHPLPQVEQFPWQPAQIPAAARSGPGDTHIVPKAWWHHSAGQEEGKQWRSWRSQGTVPPTPGPPLLFSWVLGGRSH